MTTLDFTPEHRSSSGQPPLRTDRGATADRGPRKDLTNVVDYIFLGAVLLFAGCFSMLATLPLFLLGLATAGYLAFKFTAPGQLDSSCDYRDGRDET